MSGLRSWFRKTVFAKKGKSKAKLQISSPIRDATSTSLNDVAYLQHSPRDLPVRGTVMQPLPTPEPMYYAREACVQHQLAASYDSAVPATQQHSAVKSLRIAPELSYLQKQDLDAYSAFLETSVLTFENAIKQRDHQALLLKQARDHLIAGRGFLESDQLPSHIERRCYMIKDHALSKGWNGPAPLQRAATNSMSASLFIISPLIV